MRCSLLGAFRPDKEMDMDQIDKMMAFENGELGDDDVIALFQELVNSGLAWKLQGFYGRTAKALIDQGFVISL